MLSKQSIEALAALAKMPTSELEAAIKAADEKDIKVAEGLTTLTDAELKTVKRNSYKEGKEAGIEMEVDEVKKELGLQFSGKSLRELLKAATEKELADAKLEPEKAVKEKEAQIAKLQQALQEKETEIQRIASEADGVRIKTDLLPHIPAAPENGPKLGYDDIFPMMTANGYQPKLENGVTVFYKGGEKVTDKLGNPVAAGDVVKAFIKEKNLFPETKPPAGRGGGNSGGSSGPRTLSELKDRFKAEGKSLLGQEFTKAVEEAAKTGEFDMNA